MLPGTIAFFGASSVYGAGDRESGGYVARFRCWYDAHREKGVVYNLGIPGEVTGDLVERFVAEKSRRGPHLIIFQFGANDAHRQKSPTGPQATPLEKFRQNLQFLFEQGLQNAGVGVVSPYPVNETTNPHGQYKGPQDAYYLNSDIALYADELKRAATEFKIPYLDIWSNWIQKEKYLQFLHPDGLHANPAGHADIAQKVIEFVQTHFSSF